MRRTVLIVGALAAIACGDALAAPASSPSPLLPVTDADTMKTRVSGCESWFTIRDTGYLFSQGQDVLIRIGPGRSGLRACHLPPAQAEGFERGTPIACGGRRLVLRQLGRAVGHEEADSVDYPAALTVRDGTRVHTLRGRFGTAC